MDPNFETLLRTMTEQFKQLNNRFDQIEERIEIREETRMTHTEPESPRPTPLGPRTHCHVPTPEHDYRHPHHDFTELGKRAFMNIRLDAPTFDGNLDPKVYVDWESDMEQYFEWFEMSKERKFKLAKLRLV